MATLIIEEDSPQAKKFIEYAKTLPFAKLVEREASFERIPGIPYTKEERIASIRKAEEDLANGVPGIPHSEMKNRLNKKIASWK